MSKDLRKYASDTNIRLVVGFVIILILVGLSLIWLFYGKNAALTGLLCLFAASLPVLLIGIILRVLDIIVKRINDQ